ncbi:Uncharacterised protein [Acinetobacter baumannii]|nr:hypothetical protein ACIN5111_3685 [Acinetobacter baumannii OIFC111]EXA89346.1 hypothetical protein J517_0454 [Acinetobacter baumannii 118362]EXB37983.1 hypothetical protein J544_3930 [Acinetobacter baumannii 1461963]EXH43456.1 hypothetical protein J651_1838 [Acinetobacter baumannii 1293320]MBK4746867.1 hypothetical protein [Acinetobacter baumannii]SSW87196.1 Uncharacterised protein [Klebsiella pneumoniae]
MFAETPSSRPPQLPFKDTILVKLVTKFYQINKKFHLVFQLI